jgi:membrane protease subunit HflK
MASDNENNRPKSPWDDSDLSGKPKLSEGINKKEFEDLFRKGQKSFNQNFNFLKNDFTPGSNKFILAIIAFLIFVWGSTGFYVVDEGEQALVIRFGKYVRTAYTGLNYHLPSPVESIIIEKVATLRKEEVGFRTSGSANSAQVMQESLMLTGDQNIVEINFITQWKISNLKDYVFNIDNTRETVRSAAESAMREVIGNTPIDKAITDGRSIIEHETKKLLQDILDSYNSGVEITTLKLLKSDPPAEVIDAFRDVQTAKTDKEREINRAYAFQNEVIPKARGEAAQIILESEAYEKEVVERALGESGRFNLIYAQYSLSKDITKKRMYLETMDSLLQGMDKVILDGSKAVPYLPLNQLGK